MHATTIATPEQYTAGLTDFGPGRSEIFGNSADSYLKVHDKEDGRADVTEGSGGVWELNNSVKAFEARDYPPSTSQQ
jgi:hypothetical protein